MPEQVRIMEPDELAAWQAKRKVRHHEWKKHGHEYISRTPDSPQRDTPDDDDVQTVEADADSATFQVTQKNPYTAAKNREREVVERVTQRILKWAESNPLFYDIAIQSVRARLPNLGVSDFEIRKMIAREIATVRATDAVRRVYKDLGLERPIEVKHGIAGRPDE